MTTPRKQRGALEEDAADGQLSGSRRAQARRDRAAASGARRRKRAQPLLVTENYGRGRTSLFATEGSWRWKMWLDHADKTHATFWQQMFRYLVTDTPGQVVATTPKSVLSDETQVPIRVEVRDKQYKPVTNAKVQARFLSPTAAARPWNLRPCRSKKAYTAGSGPPRSRARTSPRSSPATSRKRSATTC